MTARRVLTWLVGCGLLACTLQDTARSDELKVLTSRAIATVLERIGPQFEKNTGHKLNVITGLSSEFVERINAGEGFDVIGAPRSRWTP